MGQEQKSNKEAKKKPAMTPKEKKAAKKAKKQWRQNNFVLANRPINCGRTGWVKA